MTQRIALSALAVALVGLFALSVGQAQNVPKPEAEPAPAGDERPAENAGRGTLRIPYFGEVGTLDPHACRDPISYRLVSVVYETLYMWTPGDHPQVVPCLATDWPEVSEDGLTHTIKLRDDAPYHNSYIFGDDRTRAATAQDVVDSFKRLAVMGDEGMFWMADGLIEGLDEYARDARYNLEYGTTDTEVAGLKAVDDRTLQIKLTRPFGPLVNLLAHPAFSIVPGEAMDTWAAQLRVRAVGTGRYRLNAVSEGRLYVFKAFDDHREGDAPYKRVTFTQRSYWNEFIEAFRDGTFAETPVWQAFWDDVVEDGKLAGELAGADGTPLKLKEAGYYFLCFNMDSETWGAQDKDGRALRKAISLALDRQALVDLGAGQYWFGVQETFFPTGMEFADAGAADFGRHDLNLARETLDASKYKGGKHPDTGEPLVLNLACAEAGLFADVAEPLEEALKELGIKLNVRYLDGEQYRDIVTTSDDDMFLAGWFLDYPDPQNFLQLFWSGRSDEDKEFFNVSRYRNAEFDELYLQLEKLQPTPDTRDQRRELVSQMAAMLEKDRPIIPLVHSINGQARADAVDWPPMPRQSFNDIRFLTPATQPADREPGRDDEGEGEG